jgi:hypothetical protein
MGQFEEKVVIFLDLLGFTNIIPQFEKEAIQNSDAESHLYHQSVKLNKLIALFNETVQLIRDNNFDYYLFSDNICITVSYYDNDKLFVDVVPFVCALMKNFLTEGYYFRGGIDVGWFSTDSDIAIGTPLIKAYELEKDVAIVPRIILSDNYVMKINGLKKSKRFDDQLNWYLSNLIERDDKNYYINPFYYITNIEDKGLKIEFLSTYSKDISAKLKKHSGSVKVLIKYQWLANEFNKFLIKYTKSYRSIERFNEELSFSKKEIEFINKLKVV